MRGIRISVLTGGLMVFLSFYSPSLAQQASPAPSQQSFSSLISAGYKVVATTYVPPGTDSPNHLVLVTLQNNTSVAVCTFNTGAWENLGKTKVTDDPKVCDIRTF